MLLIDLDPQNSLTSYFGKYVSNVKKYNIYYMLKGEIYFNECINKINNYISIIPSHPILDKFNFDIIRYKESLLGHHLKKTIDFNFNYILLDTPPTRDFILQNALNVTDYIIIPVQPERWAIESLSILMEAINNVQNTRN